MPIMRITTVRRQPDRFEVTQTAIDRCLEQLGDPDAVLEVFHEEGTSYFPVRQVVTIDVFSGE